MVLETSSAISQLNELFKLPREVVTREISTSFYNLFESFFVDRFKFERYAQAVNSVFKFIEGRDKIILDVGCGFGMVSIIFSALGAKKVCAIDFSREEISGFKNILSRMPPLDNLEVRQMDGQKTEYADNSFEIVSAQST